MLTNFKVVVLCSRWSIGRLVRKSFSQSMCLKSAQTVSATFFFEKQNDHTLVTVERLAEFAYCFETSGR